MFAFLQAHCWAWRFGVRHLIMIIITHRQKSSCFLLQNNKWCLCIMYGVNWNVLLTFRNYTEANVQLSTYYCNIWHIIVTHVTHCFTDFNYQILSNAVRSNKTRLNWYRSNVYVDTKQWHNKSQPVEWRSHWVNISIARLAVSNNVNIKPHAYQYNWVARNPLWSKSPYKAKSVKQRTDTWWLAWRNFCDRV